VQFVRVALCQIDATVGDFQANSVKALAALDRAESLGADLAVLPELVLTGYPPEDLLLEPDFIAASERTLAEVASKTKRCAAVIGYVANDGGLRNAAAVCADGKVLGVSYKELLPNYGVFDERRWFVPGGGRSPCYRIGGVLVGVVVCEDAWEPTGPVDRLARQGASLICSINASPFRVPARREREQILVDRVRESQRPIVYVNLVGGQDELVFDGGSMVVGSDGSLIASTAQFRELVVTVDVPVETTVPSDDAVVVEVSESPRQQNAEPESVPFEPPLDEVAEVYEALVLATRDYVEKNRFGDVVIALSGGIDSSLVAAIATDALGKARVHGVLMPSQFSSEGSVTDAQALAANLGIDTRVIPIEPAYGALMALLAPSFGDLPSGVAEENLQARVRGTLMMALSNKFGWLVLTTGNKSETAVGYSTLYGDTAGGFAVIRDVPKLLVYELAEYRNKQAGTFVIPEAVLLKPPSAELRLDQRDDDSLPPYDVLDPIVEAYVENHASIGDLVALGNDPDTVQRIFDLVDAAEYKRRQAPPGPRVTNRGFGKDRRMPITNRFHSERSTRPSAKS